MARAVCRDCGKEWTGDLEDVSDAVDDHDQFHDVDIQRVATDGGEDLSLLHLRACQLAKARGAVPEDGSGVDGVWTDEFPDVDRDQDWLVAMNADDEERTYRLADDRTPDIRPYHAHYWWGTDLAMPAAIGGPYNGQCLVGDEFARSTEDQIIASIEAVLDELGYADFEAVIDDV